MKITKAMGMACLRASPQKTAEAAWTALVALGWGEGPLGERSHWFELGEWGYFDSDEVATALAMCAAIAGVKPEDVE